MLNASGVLGARQLATSRSWVVGQVVLVALGLAAGTLGEEPPPLVDSNPTLANIRTALAQLPAASAPLTLARGSIEVPPGGHLQGIQMRFDAQRNRHFVYLSHDSLSSAYLAVAEFPADLSAEGRLVHVHHFPSDGRSPPLRHAGGIQLVGDVLLVGLEDNQLKTRSEVQFWNVSDPTRPVQLGHLTVRRSGKPKDLTAGAVGLVRRPNDHLLAVANWDSRAIDFYLSNGRPLDAADGRFEHSVRWQDEGADKSRWTPDRLFAAYQSIHLLADAAGSLFLLGFATNPGDQDVVDLFSVDLQTEPQAILRKLASKPIKLAADNHFRFSGGAWLQSGALAILSSPAQLAAPTLLGIACRHGDATQ